eukprot:m.168140 g.168140  ORF g.168140 m.168140 type:complete len:445 (+) comp14741_c0_seq15:248-1582(+)
MALEFSRMKLLVSACLALAAIAYSALDPEVSKQASAELEALRAELAAARTALAKAPQRKSGAQTEGYVRGNDGRIQYPRAFDLVGNTPLIDLTALCPEAAPGVRILGKAEFLNPGFSHKDRIMRNILTKAEEEGRLAKGMTVVCASSVLGIVSCGTHPHSTSCCCPLNACAVSPGNTGASCAMLCSMRGYACVIITSSKCSKEKMDSIRAYGATLIIAEPGQNYMQIETDMAKANPSWFSVNQYDNLDNPEAHFKTTGPEIYAQTHGTVSHFVMAGSTGGTISGVGGFLKQRNPNVKVLLADPVGSVFTNYFRTGELGVGRKFLVEGVGKENIPGCLNISVVDDVIPVSDEDAFKMCYKLAHSEGVFVGGSAGLNVHAAVEVAKSLKGPATVVTLLCDLGVKYLSKIYSDEWLEKNGLVGVGDADNAAAGTRATSGPSLAGPAP